MLLTKPSISLAGKNSQTKCPPPKINHGYSYVTFVKNGSVKYTAAGSVVQYKCFQGYDMVGNNIRLCGKNTYWSGIQPECIRKKLFFCIMQYLIFVAMNTILH